MFSLVPLVHAADSSSDVATISGLQLVFGNIVSGILGISAIVLFVMLLLGGFQYITSGGDPQKVEQAKKTLTYAIFGVVAIALSYLILRFIGTFTGAQVTNFQIRR